jgi:predicted DNA-binding transcriptional regulator AlpA
MPRSSTIPAGELPAADPAAGNGQAATIPPPAKGRHAERHPATGTLEPLLVGREQVAALLSISLPTLDRWDSSGRLGPAGVRMGGRKLWLLSELREWAAARMPCRREWQTRRAAERRR